MKIAHVGSVWFSIPPKNYGGTESVVAKIVEEQVAKGNQVTLLASGDSKTTAKLVSFVPEALIEKGVPWMAHQKSWYHLFKSIEYVKNQHFDVIHLHLSSSSDLYIFPIIAELSLPFICTLHSPFPFDLCGQPGWQGDADKYYVEWLQKVPMVAISEKAQKEVPYPLDFVGVVHHGLPKDSFIEKVQPAGDYFLWLGRIVGLKGVHVAIEAAKKAGVKLILAGIVDRSLKTSYEYYTNVVAPLIDGDQIQYIGPANAAQKFELYSKAKALLNPILWEEPFGMVMIEAMAAGCPSISFGRGSVPEIVKHDVNGYVVDNVDQMVECMKKIDTLDRTAVRDFAKSHFSVEAQVENYDKMYKIVIDRNRIKGEQQ